MLTNFVAQDNRGSDNSYLSKATEPRRRYASISFCTNLVFTEDNFALIPEQKTCIHYHIPAISGKIENESNNCNLLQYAGIVCTTIVANTPKGTLKKYIYPQRTIITKNVSFKTQVCSSKDQTKVVIKHDIIK